MSREGGCPCGGVRFTINGPVRHVLVCHCHACREATGGPWPATAAYRRDLSVVDGAPVVWERAAVSEYGARRGRCGRCGTTLFWEAPERETVSFAATALNDQSGLEVVAHIWVGEGDSADLPAGPGRFERGLPASLVVPWLG